MAVARKVKAADGKRESEAPHSTIQSLEKGLRILDEIVAAPAPVKLAEIIKRFDIDRASAFRFLQTLEYQGFLRKDPETKEYEVGGRLYYWASQLRHKTRVIDDFQPYLQRLAALTQQTTHLGVFINDRVLLADFAMSESFVAIRHTIGGVEPLHCSAAGKAIVAFLSKEKQAQLIDTIDFVRFTERTITNRDDFLIDTELTRERGYAIDAGETRDGFSCVASPIFGPGGEPFASIGISCVAALIGGESGRFNEIIRAVTETAAELSRKAV